MGVRQTGGNPLRGVAEKLDRNIQEALAKSGDILEKESKRRVPVDTGRLRRSINYTITRITNGWRLTFGSGVKGPEVHYAKYVHWGTKYFRGIPFLSSSLSDKKKRIDKLIVSAIRRSFK